LRRNIPRGRILSVCFDEWKKTCAREQSVAPEKIRQAQALLNAENAQRQPDVTYREIARLLARKSAVPITPILPITPIAVDGALPPKKGQQ
jgi:hypothetical protein